jgi:HD-like signal output (HDOD) protein
MSKEKIEALIKTIENLPPLPDISSSVMKALNERDVSIIAVTELVEKDIALATQILKVANSPAYGAVSTISTIQHAIMMLGLDEVRGLLMAFAVQEFFDKEPEDKELRKRFWIHSQVCSYTAVLLAHHFKQQDTSLFFLSGLIHDIGKLVVDQFMHVEFQQIINHTKTHQCTFRDAEKEILGVTHYQIGGKLLQHWNFPKQVTIQLFRHHTPWKAQDFTQETFIIFLADILTKIAGFPCLKEERQFTLDEFYKSKALHLIQKNGFNLDRTLLKKFILQIKEFAACDISEE